MDQKEFINIINYNLKLRDCGFVVNDLNELLKIITIKELVEIISSKGSDRLKSFYYFVNGINHFTNEEIEWFKNVSPKYLVFLIGCYIINAQVFSDGNHRTAYEYILKSGYFTQEETNFLIEKIKIIRYHVQTDFNSVITHDIYYSFRDYINSMDKLYYSYVKDYIQEQN